MVKAARKWCLMTSNRVASFEPMVHDTSKFVEEIQQVAHCIDLSMANTTI
jgi:hypothetical protein